MSSNKTANLQLNQWAATDSFLREEFNQDNAKVDAAVQGARDANCMVKLMDITTTAQVERLDIDMSKIEWGKYTEIVFYHNFISNQNIPGPATYLHINGHVGAQDYKIFDNCGKNPQTTSYSNAFFMHSARTSTQNRLSICTMGEGYMMHNESFACGTFLCGYGYCTLVEKVSDIHSLNFIGFKPGELIMPGSRIIAYGIRK